MIQLSEVIIPGCFPTTPLHIIMQGSRFKNWFSSLETICSLFLRLGVKPFVSKFLPNSPDAPLPGNPWRLFQKSTPAARHDRPSTARPQKLLKQSAQGKRAICFKSSSQQPVTGVRQRPDPTARPERLLKQSAQGKRIVCLKSSSQQPATTGRPRPAPTVRSDELLQQWALGIRAVCFKSPSWRPVTTSRPRPALTACSDRLLKQSALTVSNLRRLFKSQSRWPVTDVRPQTFESIGARNPCRLFQKSIPAARHGRPSPWRPALTNFWNKRRPIRSPFQYCPSI